MSSQVDINVHANPTILMNPKLLYNKTSTRTSYLCSLSKLKVKTCCFPTRARSIESLSWFWESSSEETAFTGTICILPFSAIMNQMPWSERNGGNRWSFSFELRGFDSTPRQMSDYITSLSVHEHFIFSAPNLTSWIRLLWNSRWSWDILCIHIDNTAMRHFSTRIWLWSLILREIRTDI